MNDSLLRSLSEYSRYLAQLLGRPDVRRSTVAVWSESAYTGVAEGEILFESGIRLRLREELDFNAGLITSYEYEVYRGAERLFWYDDFPHSHDSDLSATFPHHKHIPPDIKHHRCPAPGISFTEPNLPMLLKEIEQLAQP